MLSSLVRHPHLFDSSSVVYLNMQYILKNPTATNTDNKKLIIGDLINCANLKPIPFNLNTNSKNGIIYNITIRASDSCV